MRAWINDIEVFMDGGNLFAITSSVNSITDPSKVKGMVTSTIKIVATPEARRACGWPHLAAPMARRVKFRAESGSNELRFDAIVKSIDRNVVELIGLGGNASWFDAAKELKLREMQWPIGAVADWDTITDSWTYIQGELLYWPLVNYNKGYDGHDNTTPINIEDML